MLKEILIFVFGAFCGIWFSWLVPYHFKEIWKGKENGNETDKIEDFLLDEDIVAKELSEKVRVLCMILISPELHYKANNINATWGKRCNVLLFFSSLENETIPIIHLPVSEEEDHFWQESKECFRYVYKTYLDKIDWVLRVDVTTFVIMENLRYLLSNYSSKEAIYFGHYVEPGKTPPILESEKYGYMDSKAGIVMSNEALRKYGKEGLTGSKLCEDNIYDDDLEFGKCMTLLGIKAMDSKDSLGRGRFFPFKPTDHIRYQLKTESWHFRNDLYKAKKGFYCCSDYAITFHDISSSYMYTLEYLIYHLRPFGNSHSVPDELYYRSVITPNTSSFLNETILDRTRFI